MATLKPNVGGGGHAVGSDRHYRDYDGAVMPRRAPHGELAAGLGCCDELFLPPEFQPLFRSTISTQPFGSPLPNIHHRVDGFLALLFHPPSPGGASKSSS
jgi:hypothetical protein